MTICPSLGDDTGFIGGVLRFVDCEVQTVGSTGYQALAAPGSSLSLALTGLLTLFVATFGYRLLLGHTPSVRDGAMALIKVGIVLVMTASWPAYRTLAYDVALRAPAEMVAEIGTPAGLPGAGGGMIARLDFADRALGALAIAGTGQPPPDPQQTTQTIPPPFGGFDAFAFGGSRILFLTAVIGAFASVRIVAGVLLALAPIFFAFLLFDATRGLFEGWVRVLTGAVLGAAAVAVVLGMELALIEPWLITLLNERAAGGAIPEAPVELLVVTLVFCLALAAIIYAMARVAMGFRMPAIFGAAVTRSAAVVGHEQVLRREREREGSPAESRSRAAAIADAVTTSQRRETALAMVAASGGRSPQPQWQAAGAADRGEPAIRAVVPLGQGFHRRTTTRVSAGARRRDVAK